MKKLYIYTSEHQQKLGLYKILLIAEFILRSGHWFELSKIHTYIHTHSPNTHILVILCWTHVRAINSNSLAILNVNDILRLIKNGLVAFFHSKVLENLQCSP